MGEVEAPYRTLASAPTGGRRVRQNAVLHFVSMSAMSNPANTQPDPVPEAPQDDLPGHLPRLGDSAYRGHAIVHWTLTIRDRGTGWLNARFTTQFRWLLLHACARYAVACPVHCLMPDHAHLLLHSWSPEGDQQRFMRFLRRHTNALLAATGHRWQPQAYDHVLRPHERDRFAFESLAHYIAQNPVRAGLVTETKNWPHTGAVIPGYPELKLWLPDYWERYWRLRNFRTEPELDDEVAET